MLLNLFSVVRLLLLIFTTFSPRIANGYSSPHYLQRKSFRNSRTETSISSSIIEILKEKFRPQIPVEIKTDGDVMLELLQEKPWRATKVKNLKVVYRPWKDGWMERYRAEDDDSIYLYTINENKRGWDKTRADEVWFWPWMWTKVKSERLSWIMKVFGEDVDAVTVQEHMEIDNFFSEFDLPVRWGILRIKELDVLNVIALNTVFFTDFNGVRPTDLGLRPDGSVKTCSVQFANCISSSNSPGDTDHYAPPFKWSRSKSPDQAYDEIKEVYMKYPKRGLKWSSGWIDRGGWKPQEFGGPYFHAQAESQAWHYTDDIEMVLDVSTREVQYRSSTRIGQRDWDVQRLRYNQFARMLEKKGGWDIKPMERLNWYGRTPFRWSQLMSDKAIDATERTTDRALAAINGLRSNGDDDAAGGTRRAFQEASDLIQPYITTVRTYLQPVNEEINKVFESALLDANENEVTRKFLAYEKEFEASIFDIRATIKTYTSELIHSVSDLLQLYEEPLPQDSTNTVLKESIDKKNLLLKGLFSAPSSSTSTSMPSILNFLGTPPSSSTSPSTSTSVEIVMKKGEGEGSEVGATGSKDVQSQAVQSSVGGSINLDAASEQSRQPWTQTSSPFSSTPATSTSTSSSAVTVTNTPVLTSSEVNARRKAAAAAGGGVKERRGTARNSMTSSFSMKSENDNDVEWIVDAFDINAPENTETVITGMSSNGRSVNKRRQQQQPLPATPLAPQESRIMKARLDELRKAYGLYVSDGSDKAVEQRMIDQFK